MKLKYLILFTTLLGIIVIAFFYTQSTQKAFYKGRWEAELLPVQKNVARIESLNYMFTDNTFIETSVYETEGMNVDASVTNYFNQLQRNNKTLTSRIYKKELNKLEYSFIEPECKDEFDCQKRELLKTSFEAIVKKSLEVTDNKVINEFKLTKKDNNTLLLKTSYGEQILHKK